MNFNGQMARIDALKNNLIDINKQINDAQNQPPISVTDDNKDAIFKREQDMYKLNLSKQSLENQLNMMKTGYMFGAMDPLAKTVPYGRTGALRDSLLPKAYDPKMIPTGGLNYDPLRDGIGDSEVNKLLNSKL